MIQFHFELQGKTVRAIGIVSMLFVIAVGVWAKFQYAGVQAELKAEHGLDRAKLPGAVAEEMEDVNSVFFVDQSVAPTPAVYRPIEPVSSGVQTNPFSE